MVVLIEVIGSLEFDRYLFMLDLVQSVNAEHTLKTTAAIWDVDVHIPIGDVLVVQNYLIQGHRWSFLPSFIVNLNATPNQSFDIFDVSNCIEFVSRHPQKYTTSRMLRTRSRFANCNLSKVAVMDAIIYRLELINLYNSTPLPATLQPICFQTILNKMLLKGVVISNFLMYMFDDNMLSTSVCSNCFTKSKLYSSETDCGHLFCINCINQNRNDCTVCLKSTNICNICCFRKQTIMLADCYHCFCLECCFRFEMYFTCKSCPICRKLISFFTLAQCSICKVEIVNYINKKKVTFCNSCFAKHVECSAITPFL